jgi:hypothetical protein
MKLFYHQKKSTLTSFAKPSINLNHFCVLNKLYKTVQSDLKKLNYVSIESLNVKCSTAQLTTVMTHLLSKC